VVVEHKDIPKPKSWKRNKHTFFLYRKRFAGHASETTEVTTHPSLLYHVIHPLTPSSRSATIPQEVQALLLEEGATVTDLDMEDPLVFDSDVSAVYPPLTIDPDVHHHQPLPPAHPCPTPAPTTPVVANIRTDPTTAAPPPACICCFGTPNVLFWRPGTPTKNTHNTTRLISATETLWCVCCRRRFAACVEPDMRAPANVLSLGLPLLIF
jgi:hypothetical protein